MSVPPRSQPRAGIGEWPVWGAEPPELWFGQIPPAPLPAAAGGHRAHPAPGPGARPASSSMSLTGFILGLVGACLSWIPLAGLACALFGAVLSLQARRATAAGPERRTLPTAGLVLGCIGMVVGVSATAVFATIALNALLAAAYGG